MAAAIEAARAGLRVTLIDEGSALGGQIYRPYPAAFRVERGARLGKDFADGERLRAELGELSALVEVFSRTEVLGISAANEVQWADERRSGTFLADQIVVATGAYDRPVPFPGWTLPGVMTAGGAQAFVKTMRIAPGKRALVAGTGPLLLVVAVQLADAGVEVVALLEAARRPAMLDGLSAAVGQWGLLSDALRYRTQLFRAKIPVHYNHAVFAAGGRDEGRVSSAQYGAVDPETWSPIRESAKTVDIDLLVVGYGFVPNTSLTRLAGCRHVYDEGLGGWIPERDVRMETSLPGVFAAGDGAGVGGVLVAVDEGRIAGIAAAQRAGAIASVEAERRMLRPRQRLSGLRRLRDFLDELSSIRPGLAELADADTLLCRCEEVPLREVQSAVKHGAKDLQALKLYTRLGMGACQGVNCGPSAALYLRTAIGCSHEAAGTIRARYPVKPVTLGALGRRDAMSPRERVES